MSLAPGPWKGRGQGPLVFFARVAIIDTALSLGLLVSRSNWSLGVLGVYFWGSQLCSNHCVT